MFVARSKLEVPQSILSISQGLAHSRLQRLDISNNAVNVYGAENLLHFLSKAAFLQVLLISNCGLGPLGVAHIAQGLKGTPELRVFSIGRNRMEDPGIISLAKSLSHVPKLEELFVYQNTLKEGGLRELFLNLRENCKNLSSLDVNDNFVRKTATTELALLLKQNLALRNINLSDCLVSKENEEVVTAFEVPLELYRNLKTGNGSGLATTTLRSTRNSPSDSCKSSASVPSRSWTSSATNSRRNCRKPTRRPCPPRWTPSTRRRRTLRTFCGCSKS
jgi:Ran GTPase-activating protein (RanGAP) involved in mRNA processing and transport